MKAPFPIDPALTGVTVAYRNTDLIADAVLPRVQVTSMDFKYNTYPLGEHFTVPSTRMGRKSQPTRVEFTATEQTASCDDYGLEDLVPQRDIDLAPANYDPLGRAVMALSDLILLDREVRVAALLFATSGYAAATNRTTLSGTSQLSDFTNSDPLGVIMAAIDSCLVRPNVMTMGQAVWTKVCQHPKVVKAVNGSSGDSGIARKAQIAELFGLQEVLVGAAYINTAKPGQAVAMSRAWGKHIALTHRNPSADTSRGITWGFTAQWGGRIARQGPDPKAGLRGGISVVVGESVKELAVADRAGHLIIDAVA